MLSPPIIIDFLGRNYRYNSVAIQILGPGLPPISYIGRKLLPHEDRTSAAPLSTSDQVVGTFN